MEIFYFEPTDEVTRAIERIRAAEDKEVALVLPQNSLILQSIVNLKLIKRISEDASKKISLVTVDKVGRNLAAQVGLPVYGKIEEGKPSGKVVQKTPEPVTPNAVRQKLMQETEEITTVTGIQVHRYDTQDPLVQLGNPPEEAAASPKLKDLAEQGMTPAAPEPVTAPIAPSTTTHWSGTGKPSDRKRRRLGMILILFALLALAGWWRYANRSTQIEITLRGEAADVSTEVAVVPNPNSDELKLQTFESEQSGAKEIAATGTRNTGDKARGSITLINNYSTAPQSIPAGSQLTLDGKTFILSQAVTIPGAEFAVEGATIAVRKSGRAEGSIEAAEAGEEYNINGGRLVIKGITAERDNKVYGENPATSGGTTKLRKVVTEADLQKLRGEILAALVEQARQGALTKAGEGFSIIEGLTSSAVSSFESSASAGTEADTVSATATVQAKILGVTTADVLNYAGRKATAGRAGQQFTTETEPTVTALAVDAGRPSARLQIAAKGRISAQINTEEVKQAIAGKSQGEALRQLEKLPLFKSASFRFSPSWPARVASRPERLTINLSYEQ